MNKLLLLLIMIGFCECNNQEKSNKSAQETVNNSDNYYSDDDDKSKPYHVDTLNKVIPTKLIEGDYNGFSVGDNVRLRTEANVKSEMIAELPNGLLLKILSRTDQEFVLFKDDEYCDIFGHPWVEVETIDGQKGWIFGKFVYKIENLAHQTISQFQGRNFQFDGEDYRFGYGLDFSHPAMDDDGLSLCDDLGMVFFYREGEMQIRPIIAKPSKFSKRIGLKYLLLNNRHF